MDIPGLDFEIVNDLSKPVEFSDMMIRIKVTPIACVSTVNIPFGSAGLIGFVIR